MRIRIFSDYSLLRRNTSDREKEKYKLSDITPCHTMQTCLAAGQVSEYLKQMRSQETFLLRAKNP